MIRAFFWILKISVFSLGVLVLGSWIHWNGRTVSDQVKTQVSHAERSELAGALKRWSSEATQQAEKKIHEMAHGSNRSAAEVPASSTLTQSSTARISKRSLAKKSEHGFPSTGERMGDRNLPEHIQSSERQKLRALIQELNSSTSADAR